MDTCFAVATTNHVAFLQKWESSICTTPLRSKSKKTAPSSSGAMMKGFGSDKKESKPKVLSYDKLKKLHPDLEPVHVYVSPKDKVSWKLTGRVLSIENQHERGLYTNKKLIIEHAKKAHLELKVAKVLEVGYSVGKEPVAPEEMAKEIVRVDGSFELIESAFDGVTIASGPMGKNRIRFPSNY